MYQACSRPGRKPRQHRARLINESALQRPRFTQTVGGVGFGLVVVVFGKGEGGVGCLPAMGGKRMAIMPRKMSELHILWVCVVAEM